jgi:hypothetical protein
MSKTPQNFCGLPVKMRPFLSMRILPVRLAMVKEIVENAGGSGDSSAEQGP